MNIETSFGVVGILRGTGKVLLIQSLQGNWGFPKGHPEAGESETETALRELEEETGVSLCELVPDVAFEERYIYERDGVSNPKVNKFFLGMIDDPALKIQESELRAAGWFTYEEAQKTIDFPEAKKVLEKARKYIKPLSKVLPA